MRITVRAWKPVVLGIQEVFHDPSGTLVRSFIRPFGISPHRTSSGAGSKPQAGAS